MTRLQVLNTLRVIAGIAALATAGAYFAQAYEFTIVYATSTAISVILLVFAEGMLNHD